jgi:hypothetical protein
MLEHFTIRLTILVTVSGIGEVCRTFAGEEIGEARADDQPQAVDCPSRYLAQQRLEFQEELFDSD